MAEAEWEQPLSLARLDAWSPVDITIWEGLGGVTSSGDKTLGFLLVSHSRIDANSV